LRPYVQFQGLGSKVFFFEAFILNSNNPQKDSIPGENVRVSFRQNHKILSAFGTSQELTTKIIIQKFLKKIKYSTVE
jgi:hypothetical protein